MKKGERWLFAAIGVLVVVAVARGVMNYGKDRGDPGIPFYSTAPKDVQRQASDLYRDLGCRDCHSLWGTRNIMQFVPAPSLDGIGSLRSEEWLYRYFSAENPQAILPSRLKKKYRMPSYAHLPEAKRRLLARYFASLKVKDWYLDEVRKAEYEKLTGKPWPGHGRPADKPSTGDRR